MLWLRPTERFFHIYPKYPNRIQSKEILFEYSIIVWTGRFHDGKEADGDIVNWELGIGKRAYTQLDQALPA